MAGLNPQVPSPGKSAAWLHDNTELRWGRLAFKIQGGFGPNL